MKSEGLQNLKKKKDTDRIWLGSISIMFILLLLFFAVMTGICFEVSVDKNLQMPFGAAVCILVYGAINIGIFCTFYLILARNINGILYQLSDMIENLINGKANVAFSTEEDTVLSKLQGQLIKLYDILRSYEEREQKLRVQLDENIGNLVHQVNTPITNIKLYAGFLKRDDLTPEERLQFTERIEEQSAKLVWLGEGFSKMSRMETGIIRQKLENQEILPMILRAVDQVSGKATRKEMNIELKGENHAFAMIDGKWAAEAVFNVLDNAVKYGNEGSSIEIEVARLTEYVCVSVRNDGIGIGQEEYHKIFKRFYRGMKAVNEEGVGLGLTIAREIMEGGKGYIKAGTLWDGRTEFSLYFAVNTKN